MKITKLKIGAFQQFKNLELDFTYPEGHEKAGKPLDKVCFIGQSGAGKTTLLEIFNKCITNVSHPRDRKNIGIKECWFKYGTSSFDHMHPFTEKIIDSINKQLIYFKSDIQANDAILSIKKEIEKPIQIFGTANAQKPSPQDIGQRIVFSNNFDKQIWENILKSIDDYRLEYLVASQKLAQEVSTIDTEDAIKNFENWKKKTPNTYDKIAKECLNPILSDFNLKLNTENIKDFYFPIQHIDGTEIPAHGLSTGTKQVLLTALPIYLFNTKDTIILFDEPERSLFPDIQLKIVDYYTQLASEAQFFFATHSPMVAAAFEPCERFILRFDEDGYVTSDSVYKGDSPIGDDPNDMLRRDFGVRYINEHGIRHWEYYLQLKNKLRTEKSEEKKQKLILEVVKLGNRYNYPE